MKKLTLIFITLLLSTTISKAEIFGHLGCGSFISACNKSDLNIDCQAQTFFVLGVLSTYSTEWDVTVGSAFDDQDNVKYALIKYCKNNPLKNTFDGAQDILMELMNY